MLDIYQQALAALIDNGGCLLHFPRTNDYIIRDQRGGIQPIHRDDAKALIVHIELVERARRKDAAGWDVVEYDRPLPFDK